MPTQNGSKNAPGMSSGSQTEPEKNGNADKVDLVSNECFTVRHKAGQFESVHM